MLVEQLEKEKIRELQEQLASEGLYPVDEIDGIFGEKTKTALQQRMKMLEEQPLPPKPWWQSKRGKGMAKMIAGVIITTLGTFWSHASQIDAGTTVDLVFQSGPLIDQLIQIVGAIIVSLGFGQSSIGALKAERPLDPTLVASIGNKEIRLPSLSKKEKNTPADTSRNTWMN